TKRRCPRRADRLAIQLRSGDVLYLAQVEPERTPRLLRRSDASGRRLECDPIVDRARVLLVSFYRTPGPTPGHAERHLSRSAAGEIEVDPPRADDSHDGAIETFVLRRLACDAFVNWSSE